MPRSLSPGVSPPKLDQTVRHLNARLPQSAKPHLELVPSVRFVSRTAGFGRRRCCIPMHKPKPWQIAEGRTNTAIVIAMGDSAVVPGFPAVLQISRRTARGHD